MISRCQLTFCRLLEVPFCVAFTEKLDALGPLGDIGRAGRGGPRSATGDLLCIDRCDDGACMFVESSD